MKAPLYIAGRYLWGRSTQMQAVHWIAVVAMIAIAVVSAALVFVISVYNGYVSLIEERSRGVDAPLVIEPKEGSFFSMEDGLKHLLEQEAIPYGCELETKALLKNGSSRGMARLVGLDEVAMQESLLPLSCIEGSVQFSKGAEGSPPTVLLGMAIAADPSLALLGVGQELTLMLPRRLGLINPIAIQTAFRSLRVEVAGVLDSQREDVDASVYLPIEVLRDLLMLSDLEVSRLQLFVAEEHAAALKSKLLKLLEADHLKVLDRREQHPEVDMLIKTERLMTYLVMLLILLLAIFNVAGCLGMLILEKARDLDLLGAMGLSASGRQRVFLFVGMLISGSGLGLGLFLGLLLAYSQEWLGWIVTGSYPMEQPLPMQVAFADIGLIVLLSIMMSYLISRYASSWAKPRQR